MSSSQKMKTEAISTKNNTKKPEEDDVFQTPPVQSPFTDPNFSLNKKEDKDEKDREETTEQINSIELSKEDIFVNLTLIAKIDVGDKLIKNKSEKHLNIDTSYFQFITRWISGNSRNSSLKFLNLVLRKAFELNDSLIKEKTETSAQTLFRLTSDLKNSLNGLNNLKQTYCYDKLIQAEIDVMIDNIRSKLDYNSKNLNFTIGLP